VKPVEFLEPCFVDEIPRTLDHGTLYVSIEHATVTHLCACGCGSEVVTPLHPARWAIAYNGEAVSLWPSVGSHSLPCRSHYIVDTNRVVWCRVWSARQAELGRARDQRDIDAALTAAPVAERRRERRLTRWWSRG
jgi:hypothetical protein